MARRRVAAKSDLPCDAFLVRLRALLGGVCCHGRCRWAILSTRAHELVRHEPSPDGSAQFRDFGRGRDAEAVSCACPSMA